MLRWQSGAGFQPAAALPGGAEVYARSARHAGRKPGGRLKACPTFLLSAFFLFGQSAPWPVRYPSPIDVAVSPDERRLYIVCEGTDELVVADTTTKSVIGRVAVGRMPRGIALTSDGKHVYVTN